MKVTINSNKCIKCWMCATLCPNIFAFKNWQTVVIKQPEIKEIDCVKEAKENCPVDAINIKISSDN